MPDVPRADTLPPALSREIATVKEWLATLPPAQRQACELMVAARVLTWAQDLERISRQISSAA